MSDGTTGNASSTMLGVIVGMAAGAAIGVLFAPRSGEETHNQMRKKANEMEGQAKQLVADKADVLKNKVDKMADKTKSAVDSGKDAANNL